MTLQRFSSGTWTSFDMPAGLTKGSITSEFVYGPEHQRTKQTRSDGITIYAGAQEVETKLIGNTSQTTIKSTSRLQATRIREAQDMKQFMSCVHTHPTGRMV